MIISHSDVSYYSSWVGCGLLIHSIKKSKRVKQQYKMNEKGLLGQGRAKGSRGDPFEYFEQTLLRNFNSPHKHSGTAWAHKEIMRTIHSVNGERKHGNIPSRGALEKLYRNKLKRPLLSISPSPPIEFGASPFPESEPTLNRWSFRSKFEFHQRRSSFILPAGGWKF